LNNEEIKYQTGGLFFTWDDQKLRINIEKHDGITFKEAAEVFCDPDVISFAPYKEEREWRFNVMGRPSLRNIAVLIVAATERASFEGVGVIRIISARRASAREEGEYYGSGL
jgi:uncharacterized DUF497 family protein